jgi:hypothetical protein
MESKQEFDVFEDIFPVDVKNYKGRATRQRKKRKASNLFLKVMVISCILSIYAYVGIAFYCFFTFQAVPDSLNYTFLPAIFGQLAAMSAITRKEKDVEIAELRYACECKQAELRAQSFQEEGGMRG